MDALDIMKFVATKDELVGGDYISLFIIDEVSIAAFICVRNVTNEIYCCNVFV